MKTCRLLAIYLAAVVLFSALAAPWLFRLCQAGMNHAGWPDWLRGITFADVLNRLLLLSAIAGGVWLLASQKALSLRTVGLDPSPNALPHLLLGLVVSISSVLLVWILGLAVGAREWDTRNGVARIWSVTCINLVEAVLIGVSEEFFFRGCLLGWLRQRVPGMFALVVVTVFYALSHFLNPPRYARFVDKLDWLSGFRMLGQYGARLMEDGRWIPECLMLLLIGLTLGWCFLRTGRLYLSIGLHAGWVFAGKMLTFLTDANEEAYNWWFGPGSISGSPITIIVLAVVFLVMVWICKKPAMRGGGKAS
jgi:membrane protease YdiL (CAAX protease family)